jgi:hypothetical protein
MNLQLALEITAGFEGGGFDNVAGNFDGQGISAGILQWNLGQGTLQPLLQGDTGYPEINRIVALPPNQGVAAAVSEMMLDNILTPNWLGIWKDVMTTRTMNQINAATPIGIAAMNLMRTWGLTNPAYYWFFDVLVQDGSLRGVTASDQPVVWNLATSENLAIWENMSFTPQQNILLRASYDRACLAKAAYRVDIFNRKATVAAGVGNVHGKYFDIRHLISM